LSASFVEELAASITNYRLGGRHVPDSTTTVVLILSSRTLICVWE